MKNLLLLLSFALMSIFAFGQSPQAFKYQAVARDLGGDPLVNLPISLKIFILHGSPEGTVTYSELHQVTTNSIGLFDIQIGNPTQVLTGTFTDIDWGEANYYLRLEMDWDGSLNFHLLGVSPLLSVPYSLYSDNGMPDGQNMGDMLYWDGSQWIKIAVGVNGQVLTLNNGVPTWGGIQLPILYTSAVSNISAFTANCGGTVVSDGGSPVIARGICWNSLPNPTTANNKTINGSGTGAFSGSMTGLAASSVYYVRAYATNSAGTSYGNEVSYTTTNGGITLTTTAITAITVNSATSGGNITNNGGSGVIARGVCWNTSPFPTTANSKTTNGSGNGVFVSELTGLAPNTLYYVRAYATNSLGTSYGNQQSFTTQNGIITLTTAEVTEIAATTAISGGEITNDGGSPVTARGVCFSTSQNPTIADSTTNDGSGNGVFVSNPTGLLPDTTYYIRSYATNGVGTYYGNEVSFTTSSLPFTCGDVVNYNVQSYNTVLIGTQCWFKENLNVGTMIPGDSEQTDNGTIEKYCYDNNPANCGIYGGLYQWNEMMQYSTTPGIQGICPSGWHVPTEADFCSLEQTVDPTISCSIIGWRGINGGGKLKEVGLTHWNSPNTGATNMSGFNALPAGSRNIDGTFNGLGIDGTFWSSSQNDDSNSWRRGLDYSSAGIYRLENNLIHGFSLRCLKDENTTSLLIITPEIKEVTAPSGSATFNVISNISWKVEENTSWLSVSPTSGSCNDILIVTYQFNSSPDIRIGQILITADGGNPVVIVTITQEGTPLPTTIGENYGGGKVAYFFQPGEPGYIESEVHGLIAAPSDQSNSATWGCYFTSIPTSTAIGTGQTNTTLIVNAGCCQADCAAHFCNNLLINGYDDWFLPSLDELNKLYLNRIAIGGFASASYWSSSHYSGNQGEDAWYLKFSSGAQSNSRKDTHYYVRAIRAF